MARKTETLPTYGSIVTNPNYSGEFRVIRTPKGSEARIERDGYSYYVEPVDADPARGFRGFPIVASEWQTVWAAKP